jgi:hypothetical protein
VQYYRDFIRYKRENGTEKRIINILLTLEILFGYIYFGKSKIYLKNFKNYG